MLTYFLRCDVGRVRRALGGDYKVTALGGVVRLVESFVALYEGDTPLCMYKSWRLTYAEASLFGVSRAEVLVRRNGVIVRLVRSDERVGLPELAEGSPLVIHAVDVNEFGATYRVFRMGEYVELASRGVASSIKEIYRPKRGVNILIADVPTEPKFRQFLEEAVALAREHYVELHVTMMSDVCPLCGVRMERHGKLVSCARCGIRLSRDVNATWALARNIVRRLGRSSQLAELRELFRLYYPYV